MTKIWLESGNVKLVQAVAIEQKDDIMHSPNNPPLLPDHFKLKMDGISSGKWTEFILFVWEKCWAVAKQVLSSTVGAIVRVLNSNCLLSQTRLLVMPRWINNGWLRRAEKKLIQDGNKCLTMNGGGGLTFSWRSRRGQVLSLGRFQIPPRTLAAPPPHPARRRACQTSSWPPI